MNQENQPWLTEEARKALDAWTLRHQPAWVLEGADPEEIRDDLEAHLWRSRNDGQDLVSLDTVEDAIVEMGLPEMAPPFPLQTPALGSEKTTKLRTGFSARVLKSPFLRGIWPLLVVLFELATGTLSQMFFDPMSRPGQTALVILVALLGAFGVLSSRQLWTSSGLLVLRGMGVVVTGYFSLLALPVLIVGTMAYAYGVAYSFGAALLAIPIYLLCAAAAAAPLFLVYGFLREANFARLRSSWIAGFLAGVGLLLIVEGPAYVTRYGVAHDKVSLVRKLGSEDTLHLMCFEGARGRRNYTDSSGFLTNLDHLSVINNPRLGRDIDFNKRREFYYRVSGRSADSHHPGSSFLNSSRGSGLTWDPVLGGDGVAARIAGLDLNISRLDGHLDAASRLGYWEWTMEFKNTGFRQQEARMQLLLPNNGVVSRLTLWVNDEPQEAAFAATAKVTEAYKTIVVRERRDPVLVRWVGADRIMAQCFPVPAEGSMKIRIGVTAPLDEKNRLYLPRIIEKNFGISEDLETGIWVQGDLEMQLDGLEGKGALSKWRETHGTLPALALMNRHTHVQGFPGEQPKAIWTKDPFAESDSSVLVQTHETVDSTPTLSSIMVVIDGSSYFAEWAEAADRAIGDLRALGHEVTVIAAVEEEVRENIDKLDGLNFAGGQDCVPALESALSTITGKENTTLLWLHGQQPIRFQSDERFFQLLERGFHQVDLNLVDLAGGPNRLLEEIAKRIPLSGSARPDTPADLSAEIQGLLSPPKQELNWARQANDLPPESATKVWDQLARWQAWQTIKDASLQKSDRDELAKLAARYQLVTPVSGAVVLETKAQYKRFGLEQVDPDSTPSIPGIPEPSTALLSFFSLFLIWQRRRKTT